MNKEGRFHGENGLELMRYLSRLAPTSLAGFVAHSLALRGIEFSLFLFARLLVMSVLFHIRKNTGTFTCL